MGANDPEYPFHRVLREFLEDHQRLVDNYPQLTLRIISTSPLIVTQDGEHTVELMEIQDKVVALIQNGQAGPTLASGGSLETLPCAVLLDNYIPKVVWSKDGTLSADIECSFPRVALYSELGPDETIPSFQAGFPLFQTEPYDFLLKNIEQIMIVDVSNQLQPPRGVNRPQGKGKTQGTKGVDGSYQPNVGEAGDKSAIEANASDQGRSNLGRVKWGNHDQSSDDEGEPQSTRATPGIGVAGIHGRDNMQKLKETRNMYHTAQSQESITDLLFKSGPEIHKQFEIDTSSPMDKVHVNGGQGSSSAGIKIEAATGHSLGSRKKSEVKVPASTTDGVLLKKRSPSEQLSGQNESGEAVNGSRAFHNLGEGAFSADQRGPQKRLKTGSAIDGPRGLLADPSANSLTYEELLASLNPEAPLLSWHEVCFSAATVQRLKDRLLGAVNSHADAGHPKNKAT